MKIYNEIRIDIDTGETIYEESFEYHGEIAMCGGGSAPSSTTTTVDPVYNAGMLNLSEEQQDMASSLFNMAMYGVEYNPTEKAYYNSELGKMISETERNRLPANEQSAYAPHGNQGMRHDYDPSKQTSEMQYMQNVVNANQELLGLQTSAETENIKAAMEGFRTQAAQAKAEGEMIGPRQELELANIGLTTAQIDSLKSLIGPQQELSLEDIKTQMQQMGLSQEQVAAASELLPQQTGLASAEIQEQLKQLGLNEAQIASAMELLPQQTELSSAEMDSRLKQLGLTDAQTSSALQLLPQQTALTEAQLQAETGLVPERAGLESEQIAGARELTPFRTAAERAQLEDTATKIGERAPVRSEMYKQALEGIDVEGRVGQAQADVEHGFKTAAGTRTRELQRFGLDPSDPRYQSMTRAGELEKAKTIAGKRTLARDLGEQEKFARLTTAMTL
ncbi:MAG: hypothetical protein GY861_28380 [bacterium]|nr:hypothetical protein [bacterium]